MTERSSHLPDELDPPSFRPGETPLAATSACVLEVMSQAMV